jgi:hypothetical protein
MTETSPPDRRLSRRSKITLAVGVLVVVAIAAVVSIAVAVSHRTTVTVTPWQPAHAVFEGAGFDPKDVYRECPTYTDLRVTPPDTPDTFTVPTSMDTCELQVHPVGSDM